MTESVPTVMTWHEALNAGDVDGVVVLADADVEMGGPRGTVSGVAVLREWAEQGIQLQPRRIFQMDERVVVGHLASWCVADTGAMTDPEPAASAFVVRDERIMSIIRYPDLPTALEASRLTTENEVTLP